LVNELVTRFGADVTAVLKSRTEDWGPQISQLPGVKIVEAPQLDDATLRAAGAADARALAFVDQDDVGNIHAALRAHELNPDLRMVVRMFNMSLGHRIRTLFADCTVLSDVAMAAPSFVAAALGEVAPSHVRLPGRTLYVTRRDEVPAERIVCGLADTTMPGTRLLPAEQESADLVLASADGTPRNPLGAHRTSRFVAASRRVRVLLTNKLVLTAIFLVGLLAVGLILLSTIGHDGWGDGVYLTLLDAAGDAVPDPKLSLFNKIVQVIVTLSGLALIPVVTASVVEGLARARVSSAGPSRDQTVDHVVVVGLGGVGSRVVSQLHDLGIPVVGVEVNEQAVGVPIVRRLGVPIVFGDATREDVMRTASVASSRALLLLTRSDVVNLEAALQGRAQREELRVVLRLFDDDLARRVERVFGIGISRSVSSLAASAFAAAMVERQVIGTIPIGRRVLMVAEVPIAAGSQLVGQPASAAHEQGEARVIALQRKGSSALDWSPDQSLPLAAQDRLLMLATRPGLGRVLARSLTPVPQVEAG
jgi:Trk K+ transport system NAD-binding subunit